MNKPWNSLRARLTLWYVLLVGVTLALFGALTLFGVQQRLLIQYDLILQSNAAQMIHLIRAENDYPVFDNTKLFQSTAQRLTLGGYGVRLLDRDGTLRDGFGAYETLPTFPLRASSAGHTTLNTDADSMRVYSRPITANDGRLLGWLQISRTLAPLDEGVATLQQQLLLIAPFILALMALGGFIIIRRALRPLDQLTRTAETIERGDLAQRVNYRGAADEIGRLAATFDRMLDSLQAAFEREKRFTADAAHELRTPLTAIKGRIEVTLNQSRTNEEYATTLRDVDRQVNRLMKLTTDLLFLARLDQPNARVNFAPLDLSDLLASVLDSLQPLADAKQIIFERALARELPMRGDFDQLVRLFTNLLDNALKFTPANGVITLAADATSDGARVVIRDTGVGIAPEHLPHLFERFYRADTNRARDERGGAGLGLAIAAEIARRHGGRISVESALGHGATFTVYLPNTK